MTIDTIIVIFFLLFVLIMFLSEFNIIFSVQRQNHKQHHRENFSWKDPYLQKAECSDTHCEDTKLLKLNHELLEHSDRYMTVDEFNKVIMDLQSLTVSSLKDQVSACSDMNGADGWEKKHMTFECMDDVEGIEDDVIDRLTAYMIEYGKAIFGINLNPIIVFRDFKVYLNLLEDIIYPLMYSNLYTVNGIQYFTEPMLVEKVVHNLKMLDTVYTILQRRGIEVLPTNDHDI